MKIPVCLKHLIGGTVNSPTANPITLAIRDAGLSGATTIGVLAVKTTDDHNYPLPAEVRDFLMDTRRGDRFEALPPLAQERMNAAVSQLISREQRAAKKGKTLPLQVLSSEFELFSFSLQVKG